MSIMITNFVPSYCPQCGAETKLNRIRTEQKKEFGIGPEADYLAGASYSCQTCGLGYQLANTADILEAAKQIGDLAQYHSH